MREKGFENLFGLNFNSMCRMVRFIRAIKSCTIKRGSIKNLFAPYLGQSSELMQRFLLHSSKWYVIFVLWLNISFALKVCVDLLFSLMGEWHLRFDVNWSYMNFYRNSELKWGLEFAGRYLLILQVLLFVNLSGTLRTKLNIKWSAAQCAK